MASSPTGVENSERASQVLLEGLRLIRTYVSRRPWVFGTAVFGGFVYSIITYADSHNDFAYVAYSTDFHN